MLQKQAKVLSDKQIKVILLYLDSTSRNRERNKVMFSSLHGLRAKEIAELEMTMITDAEGDLTASISLQDKASKGRGGRIIAMNKALKLALEQYLLERHFPDSKYAITTERASKFSPNAMAQWFSRLYKSLGFEGCSSHSGRRTFITKCARKVSLVGGSLRDVQLIAGHRYLGSTQKYINSNEEAQKKLIEIIYQG